MNLFIEGIQGMGKTTLLEKIARKYPEYTVYREGDYCPVELSWCAWMNEEDYQAVCRKYEAIQKEIEKWTVKEKGRYVVCYTRILTDIPGFHKDMENWEIYNGRKSLPEFQEIILRRFQKLPARGEGAVYECAFFQNILEEFLLYHQLSQEEIFRFYEKLFALVKEKDFHLYYIYDKDIEKVVKGIVKERCDEKGNPLWYPLMLEYLRNSPWGKQREEVGFWEMIEHFRCRQALELKIIREILGDAGEILTRKNVRDRF